MIEICPYYIGRDNCMKLCISGTHKTVHNRDVYVLKELYVIKFGICKEIGQRELSQIILRSLLGTRRCDSDMGIPAF